MGISNNSKNFNRSHPFSLVYGSEVVLLVEVEIRSLRTIIESELPKVQWGQERHNSLTTLDSHRLKVLYHTQLDQARLPRAFNKKVKHKSVKLGDWVLKQAKQSLPDPREKFRPN